MKYLLVILSLVLLAPAQAEEKQASCADIAKLAGVILSARYNGLEMAKAYELSGDSKATQMLIEGAYEKPSFTTDTHQQRAIREFKDEVFMACIKARK